MRILLVISSLRCGGAEKVMSGMASYWAAKGHEVHLLTLAPRATDFFRVDPAVRRIDFDLAGRARGLGVLTTNIRRFLAIRRAVQDVRPEVVISFAATLNMVAILAAARTKCRVVVSERTDPRMRDFPRLLEFIRSALYRRADCVVVQTHAVAVGWGERIVGGGRLRVIPNPVIVAPVSAPPRADLPEKLILGAGRLVPEKGFDLLIEAFAQSDCAKEGWTLLIAGEGPQRTALERLIADLGLQGHVRLPGQVADLAVVLDHASVFVLSSRFEGFPNVLLEAMAKGVPVISADCPSGPAELIEHEHSGLLVAPGNATALADAIRRLASDTGLRRALAAAARSAAARYDLDTIMALWSELLTKEKTVRPGRRLIKRRVQAFVLRHPALQWPSRMISRVRFLLWRRAARRRARRTLPALIDVHKTVWVNPGEIKLSLRQGKQGVDKYRDRGTVMAGDWDLDVTPFEEKDVYASFVEHFKRNRPWEETVYFHRLLENVREGRLKRGMETEDDLRARMARLDALHESIRLHGYKAMTDLPPSEKTDLRAGDDDEVSVRIGRDGQMIFEDGRHRLALAKVLGVQQIPVKITVRHREWVNTLAEVDLYVKRRGRLYNVILHPDLADIRAAHGHERFEAIRPFLPPPPGQVLDIGCHWGYFCIRLERMGFRCTGVEAEQRNAYMLEKMRRAHGCSFDIFPGSIFDYRSDETFDLVLALYIFHHFLKSEQMHAQMIDLLGRLKMKRMIFGAHNVGQSAMKAAYRNYTPQEFVDVILQHSCLKNVRSIGTEQGRRELFLLEV